MADYEEMCLELIAKSADALLLSDGGNDEWIPKSLIKNPRKDWETGNAYMMEVETWKLKDVGFI